MPNVFSLDAIRSEARKRYEPVAIGLSDGSEVKLCTLLKLDAEDRKTVVNALEQIKEIDTEDDEETGLELLTDELVNIFTVIADRPTELLAELHDPDPEIKVSLLTSVLQLWGKETQLGEAPNSPA